jgi:prevent-host-death family protein
LWYDHGHEEKTMKKISAGMFKTHCLSIMEDVRATRHPVLITKRGRPVAKLVPADTERDDFLGRLEGIVKIVGDIESPVEPPESWEAFR